jgi:hypothetical protein
MVHTFQNVNFELGSIDPMNPPYWTASFTYTFEEISAFNSQIAFPSTAYESFELGYTQGLVTSPQPSWSLTSGETINYKVNGGAIQTYVVPAGIPPQPTATGLAASITTLAPLLEAYASGDNVYIVLETNSQGATLEILATSTATSLALSPGVYLQEDNSFFLYSFSSLDTQASSFSSGAYQDSKEAFSAQWSELSADFVTPLSESFIFSGGETLELTVDDFTLVAPPTYTVTFTAGTKTAQDVADEVNAVSSPAVVSSALPSGQVKLSCPGDYRKSLRVGGTSTSILGLDAVSPNPVVVKGTEDFTLELLTTNSALFSAFEGGAPTSNPYEDFESEWPDNQDYMYVLTTRTITYNTVDPYQTYNATVNGSTVSYEAAVGDTPSDVASAIASKINALSGFTSTSSVGEVSLAPADERNRVDYSANEPLNSDVVVGAKEDSAKISFAVFTGSKPEEDFEAQWLNNENDKRVFTSQGVAIEDAVASTDYTVTINGVNFTHTSNPPVIIPSFERQAIAQALALLIDGTAVPGGVLGTTYVAMASDFSITVSPPSAVLDISVDGPDGHMVVFAGDASGLLGRAIFDNGTASDEEDFILPVDPVQKKVDFQNASVGVWEISTFGQTFFVDNTSGTLSVTDIRDSFVNQISIGSIELDAFSEASDVMGLRSSRVPPANFEISVKSPNPPLDFTLENANTDKQWAYDGTLTSLI